MAGYMSIAAFNKLTERIEELEERNAELEEQVLSTLKDHRDTLDNYLELVQLIGEIK